MWLSLYQPILAKMDVIDTRWSIGHNRQSKIINHNFSRHPQDRTVKSGRIPVNMTNWLLVGIKQDGKGEGIWQDR